MFRYQSFRYQHRTRSVLSLHSTALTDRSHSIQFEYREQRRRRLAICHETAVRPLLNERSFRVGIRKIPSRWREKRLDRVSRDVILVCASTWDRLVG